MGLNRNVRNQNGRRWNSERARETLNLYGQRASVRLREAPPQDISRQPSAEQIQQAQARAQREAINQGRRRGEASPHQWTREEFNQFYRLNDNTYRDTQERAREAREANQEENQDRGHDDPHAYMANLVSELGLHNTYYRHSGGLGMRLRERTPEDEFFDQIDRIGSLERRIEDLKQQVTDAYTELGVPNTGSIYHRTQGEGMTSEERRNRMRERARRRLMDAAYGTRTDSTLRSKMEFFKRQDIVSTERQQHAEELELLSNYNKNTNNLNENELKDIL